jgi:hypothetical protein
MSLRKKNNTMKMVTKCYVIFIKFEIINKEQSLSQNTYFIKNTTYCHHQLIFSYSEWALIQSISNLPMYIYWLGIAVDISSLHIYWLGIAVDISSLASPV